MDSRFPFSSVLLVGILAKVASGIVGASVGSDGVSDIFGNHFGQPGVNATYDYIVVGGGNAGNTIAVRLALDPANYSVAVIEAGNFYEILNGNRTQVPGYNYIGALSSFVGDEPASLTAFGLKTEPQAGYNGREIIYVAGQSFGGGRKVACMYFLANQTRPSAGSHDHWADFVGDDFWTWDNVYPYYKKSVTFIPPDYTKIDPSINITWDSTSIGPEEGPLHISYGNFQGHFGSHLGASLDKLGFEKLAGINSGKMIGYGTVTSTVDPRTATRDSSETSFLQLAARNSNIQIYPNTLAKKILFDADKKATGVLVQGNFATAQFEYKLKAAKEVIVSAGVWHSPQLLMVSGVGPACTLKAHGIDVVSDLPGVGQNERDQPFMALTYKVSVTTNTQMVAGNPKVNAEAVAEYLDHQSGRLSGIGAGQAVAFEKIPAPYRNKYSNSTLQYLSAFPEDWPEVEYLPLESSGFPADIGPDDNYLLIGAAMLSPKSIGNMTIASADVLDPPVISPNWLLDPADLEQIIAAVHRIREIAFNSSIVEEEYLPGPDVTTDAEIAAWLKENMSLIYHGGSTCRMGPKSDPDSVVDTRARVRGVKGLRVVDASAFPFVPPGQPMSVVYMFAERIADAILNDL
ncbi:GMC oxidoreductase [Pleomassaria siparia CBS 279.74]|uniref:GMC oxidoreductase n=1 Tax=Pleomassaria siparia CBS 279.74 TaxID=1314801 RepID=A0A6G1KDX7_9PLEO|nr:GMC oxidoreductase [Pleomassaria siparia CBS 279.74]